MHMATNTIREKKVDLPPRGPRNADPITDAAGAHPIEAGMGAALGGAAAGFAAGVAAGPVGAVAGAILGGVAGGYGGHAIGEWIDPTTDDQQLEAEFEQRNYVKKGETYDDYVPFYQYGGRAEGNNVGRTFDEVETGIQKDYDSEEIAQARPWNEARPAVKDGYTRAQEIRKSLDRQNNCGCPGSD
jgi:hypothetical protein